MTVAVPAQPSMRQLVQDALKAFRSDSVYAAEMVAAARKAEGKRRPRSEVAGRVPVVHRGHPTRSHGRPHSDHGV